MSEWDKSQYAAIVEPPVVAPRRSFTERLNALTNAKVLQNAAKHARTIGATVVETLNPGEMITVDLCDGRGIRKMPRSKFTGPHEIIINNEREFTRVIEYRIPGTGQVVHRSVHVHLKQGLGIEAALGGFGG